MLHYFVGHVGTSMLPVLSGFWNWSRSTGQYAYGIIAHKKVKLSL
jgi:hypothetical protein